MKHALPEQVAKIIQQLQSAGFEAYAVGGAVRDLLLGLEPKDWDVATKAKPEEIQKVFPDSVYENEFGTVGVKLRHGDKTEVIEVTTYRAEQGYADVRHPDKVEFVQTLEEDLARRDFTINAMAVGIGSSGSPLDQRVSHDAALGDIPSPNKVSLDAESTRQSDSDGGRDDLPHQLGGGLELKDPFGGRQDLQDKLVRAVGQPSERFQEDALRLLRAVRFATVLEFKIEDKTKQALIDNVKLLDKISVERIRDEFVKIIMSPHATVGVRSLQELGLLKLFLPELVEGFGVAQNKHHIYEVFEHSVRSLDYAAQKNYSLVVRLAALFHDIGKPRSKHGEGEAATFYNHEVIGAKLVAKLMNRLHFSREVADRVVLLVRHHQFYYTPEEVTASSVRRLVAKVGLENIKELLYVREADRIGSGVPKAVPYKLRHLEFMVEKVSTDPISPKMLKINGNELMQELSLKPSKKLGLIINSLLAEVIEEPKLNSKEALLNRARELNKMSDSDLAKNLAKIEQAQSREEEAMKKKYYVK